MAIPGNVGGNRSTGMSPGAMGGKIGSGIGGPAPSKPKGGGMSPGERKAKTGFAAPKKDLAKQFFKGPVSDDRLRRRLQQDKEERDFISTLKPVEGTGGTLLQEQAPVFNPMTGQYERTTLAQKRQQLANKYGPTFSEIMSDVGYAGGQIFGNLAERAMSGGLGFLGAIKEVANYALNKANQGYDKLNSVQQEIFDNPDKYPYASKVPQVEAVNNSRELALEADRDALGLELDALLAEREAENRFRYDNPTVDMRSPTREELEAIDIDGSYVESGQFKKDLEKSGILTVDVPTTGEPLPDSTKIPGTNTTLGDLKEELKKQNYNDFQITGIINEMTQRIISGEDVSSPIENIGEPDAQTYGGLFEGSPMRLEIPQEGYNFSENILAPVNILEDKEYGEMTYIDPYLQSFLEGKGKAPVGPYGDPAIFLERLQQDEGSQSDLSIPKSSIYSGTQVTAYNNPGNLQFAGQQGAIEGQTYGDNFAVFPNAEAGISALKNDLIAKVNRSNKVDDIIGEYAPKADNPESFNNYVSFVKDRVGETVEPNELDDLTRSVIQFENKPSIANQYLNLLDQPTLVADASKRDIQTLKPIRDMGIGYDMGADMFKPVIRDLKEKNPSLTDEEIRGIIEGTITEPTGVFAADGGMIDKQLKSLQNGLQNMYNGIPSVKRR